jgi:hypothetical protein
VANNPQCHRQTLPLPLLHPRIPHSARHPRLRQRYLDHQLQEAVSMWEPVEYALRVDRIALGSQLGDTRDGIRICPSMGIE